MAFEIKRGQSFVDAWTVIHVAFWLVVGGNLAAFDTPAWLCAIVFGVGALLWEVVEHFVIDKMLGWVKHPESALNSWVSDILAAFVGGYAGYFLIGTGGL